MTGQRVVVRAPATVANLGPGFDCLGLALAWYDEVRVERRAGSLEISASGPGAREIPRDAGNPVAAALARLLGSAGGLSIHESSSVPIGRGLGSSAAAIVAGLLAGRALGATSHSDEDLLELAASLEGHPDNVAPCLLGGLTITTPRRTYRFDPPGTVLPLLCVAPGALPTRQARAVVPSELAREAAVANASRTALLAGALTGAVDARHLRDALLDGTEDLLHQPGRFAMMPETGALAGKLRAAGIAAFLSGAGPSICALVPAEDADRAAATMREAAPEGWDLRTESFSPRGAEIVEVG